MMYILFFETLIEDLYNVYQSVLGYLICTWFYSVILFDLDSVELSGWLLESFKFSGVNFETSGLVLWGSHSETSGLVLPALLS